MIKKEYKFIQIFISEKIFLPAAVFGNIPYVNLIHIYIHCNLCTAKEDSYNKQIAQICDSVGWHNLASGDTNRLEQRVGQ